MKNIYKTNDVSIFKNVKSDQLALLSQNRRCIKKISMKNIQTQIQLLKTLKYCFGLAKVEIQ